MTLFSTFPSSAARLLLGSVLALGLASCDSDDEPEAVDIPSNSVLVLNEGNFQKANAEVSVFSKNTNEVLYKSAFSAANKESLGDVAQNISLQGSTAYIVVNNSNKLEAVSLPNFKRVGKVENLKLPRYFVANGSKGYVTETIAYDGQPGQVSVINLNSYSVAKTITVGKQPERLLLVGNRLYVTNSGDNTVTVINTTTDQVEGTITVGDSPNSLAQDFEGNVWVLSGGKVAYNADYSVDYTRTTKGSLAKIIPGQLTVATTLEMPSNLSSPNRLTINGTKNELFYTYQNGVYLYPVGNATLATSPIIRRNFYALAVDPVDRTVYGGVASFTSTDKVIRYRTGAPGNAYTAIDSFSVNIGPNGFVFN
ncbi:hypothetical protein DNI29_03500 [Hymenobacter sediminis]|uniref:YncE family protein n=1 Tax=Hymenobacter sediminis TaxID=2218621 RepID=UPI000DA6AF2D|nr:hypothetical protein [Hymenobacter sediminis]RPD49875.1 hypothetical protein DNI29_03500 [Hymenobacter sediminis]